MENLILMSDSYKLSHWKQYPKGADGYFGYVESRQGWDEAVFFGVQQWIKRYLCKPITREMIDEAEEFAKMHGEPFYRLGWLHILWNHDGYIPVTIKAAPEGMIIPRGNAMLTVECTDPACFWVGSFIEKSVLQAVWYGTTVATQSREAKKIIYGYLDRTSDAPDDNIVWKLHDFGARGVSSHESAMIGGAAHLVNFYGSDTMEGVYMANKYYGAKMAGYSIPAAEHSTITSWGKENEFNAYRNMLKQYGGAGNMLAVVSDSYDIDNAVINGWGGELKADVINSGATVIIRPDSGDPVQTPVRCIENLAEAFGYTVNKKGFKVLNNVRVIQGDGITLASIQEICATLFMKGFSIDNIAFGMGGALLQKVDRDTLGFAMKCSALRINGVWQDVFKAPKGSEFKKSKKGRLSLYQKGHGERNLVTLNEEEYNAIREDERLQYAEVLVPVYQNGKLLVEYDFEGIRERAKL